ncbi:MAG: transporter permease [Humibacillus sp.]|nr:transporter permease [Humibacillus sp.]
MIRDATPHASSRTSARTISRYGLAIAVAGALVQLVLGVYYLYMGHAPQPHDVPIGVVASAGPRDQLRTQLESGGQFTVGDYQNAGDLTAALKTREVYGGVVIAENVPTLYVASAASPAVATVLKGVFQNAYQQQLTQSVASATADGAAVPAATVKALTTPPRVVDVVALPADDRAGSSLGFLIQALCLGGSIASLALGRLGRLTRRSFRRGVGHAALLVVYALASSLVVLVAMRIFDVGPDSNHLALFSGFALVSLAVTASTAACVAVFGAPGALLGALYFTVGLVISGSSIAPEMLPDAGRRVGQLLPPGAGATVVRDALYFPDAATTGPFVILGLYAAVGLLVVLMTNALANRTTRVSTLEITRHEDELPVSPQAGAPDPT